MNAPQATIYCDMDGVLANFIGYANHVLGKPWDTFKTPAEKEHRSQLTFEAGPQFWENIPPLGDFYHLWNYLHPFNPSILTAVPSGGKRGPTESSTRFAREGKWEWIKRHCHIPYERFHCVQRQHKQDYATKAEHGHIISNILIDDLPQNINEWLNNRGTGILHRNASDTIRQLKALGFVNSMVA